MNAKGDKQKACVKYAVIQADQRDMKPMFNDEKALRFPQEQR